MSLKVIRPNSPAMDYSVLDNLADKATDDNTKIEKCIMYICYLKEPSKVFIDKRALSAIKYLNELTSTAQNMPKIQQFVNKHEYFYQVVTETLKYYHGEVSKLTSGEGFMNVDTNEGVASLYFSDNSFFYHLSFFYCYMTNCSKDFCLKWHSFKGTEAILAFLNDDELMKKLPKFFSKKPHFLRIFNSTVAALVNLSTLGDYYRKDFEDLKAVDVLMKSLNYTGLGALAVTYLYIILTNIVNDDEISNLPGVKRAVENIEGYVKMNKHAIETGYNLKRETIEYVQENGSSMSVSVCRTDSGLHLFELLTTIVRLAVNDKMKIEIYETYDFKDHLDVIIMKGNEFEKACAAKLLWQLCFAQQIAKSVYENVRLYEYIESLSKSKTEFSDLKKWCEGILWSIEKVEGLQKRNDAKVDPLAGMHQMRFRRKIPANHIMISYNSESRELCLKIKHELERQNHKVWIDVESIHGSSLEAMATAVEDSKCVLICATEKYKQSPNCRAEAEYTFKLNKPFIPLIMQPHYSPDGWLGIIIGSKIYINFTKYHFSEALDRLFKEINLSADHTDSSDTHHTSPSHTTITPIRSEPAFEKWSKEDVKKWLKESNVDAKVAQVLNDFSGRQLKALKTVWKTAPDYFYQTMSQNNTIPLLSVLNFTDEFDKLT